LSLLRWACAVLLAGAASARAQSAPAPEPQRIEIRGENSSDTDLRRRDPVAKTVVGREELDKYDDASIADVLKRQPGVNLQSGNPRLRGLGAGYTLILVNGEPAPPGFSLENLPPTQVERIEITKGPTAEFSAQAVAGTINIILRAAPRQRQRELSVRLGYTRGRIVPGFNALWADRLGDVSVSVPVSGYQWAGGNDNSSQRLTRDPRGALLRSDSTGVDRWWGGGFNLSPRVSWKLDDETTLEWQSFLVRNEFKWAGQSHTQVDETVGNGSRFLQSVDESVRNAGIWQNGRTGLSLTRRWPEGARLEARVGSQASRNRWATHTDGFLADARLNLLRDVSYSASEQTRNTSGKYTRPWKEDHTLAFGWDAELKWRTETRSAQENGQSQLSDFEARPFSAEVRRIAAYAQDEWQIAPRWSTYLGLRAESITTTTTDNGQEQRSQSSVVTPVIHLQHKLGDKGRDMLRASLTRSYKAPDLNQLLARPTLNAGYPAQGALAGVNPESAPDRVGNPLLKPELATGLDAAIESYLPQGGVVSLGLFHRRISGLIRNELLLGNVSWSSFPRWYTRPVNLESATSIGVELEIKGRADELWPSGPLPGAMNLRFAFSAYRSQVRDIPGPDNRLDQQQPWTASLGFDHRVAGTPLGMGANLGYTPNYATQLTTQQRRVLAGQRNADGYVSWTFSRELVARLSVNNFPDQKRFTRNETQESGGPLLWDDSLRRQPPSWNLGLTAKF
jgi:outer membrane receptor for ferrienterochelin and colicins